MLGDKVVSQLKGHVYTIVNDDFEATVEIDRNDIEDDNFKYLQTSSAMAGESSKQWADDLVFAALTGGLMKSAMTVKPSTLPTMKWVKVNRKA